MLEVSQYQNSIWLLQMRPEPDFPVFESTAYHPSVQNALRSSQQVSGNRAQAWHAAKLSESLPCPLLMMQTGSLEHDLEELTAFLNILGKASGRPCLTSPPRVPSESPLAV